MLTAINKANYYYNNINYYYSYYSVSISLPGSQMAIQMPTKYSNKYKPIFAHK